MKIKELIAKFRESEHAGRQNFFFNSITGIFEGIGDVELSEANVLDFYLEIKRQLQILGMKYSHEDSTLDESMWAELTQTLTLAHDVLVRECGAELPKPRVVSIVTEMVEMGALAVTKGEDGQEYVRPESEDHQYAMKIRITKVPMGRAPEDFRKLWVGMELPARPGVPGAEFTRIAPGRDNYVVPFKPAIGLLREKSGEAARWFEKNFSGRSFLFGTDEAEVV